MSNYIIEKLAANVASLSASEIPDKGTETELEKQPFPVESFGCNPLSRMANECARVYGTPPQLPFMLGLSVVSIAAQRSHQLKGAFDQPRFGNFFQMGIARSATGKSNIFKEFFDPLMQRQSELDDEHQRIKQEDADELEDLREQKKILMSERRKLKKDDWRSEEPEWQGKEGQIKADLRAVNEEIASLQNRPHPKLYVDNITPEALAERLSETDGYLGIASPEAADVLDIFSGRYASNKAQLALLNKGFSSDPHLVDRRGDGESKVSFTIPQATLSLALLVQPEKALEFFSMPQVHDQGTLGRFSLFDTRMALQKRSSESTTFDEGTKTDWASFVNRLIDLPTGEEDRCIVQAAVGTREAFNDYYNECLDLYDQKSMTNMESQMYLRSSEKAMAFSLLLNIADSPHSKTLSVETARRGIAVEKYLLSSGLQFVSELVDHKKDAYLKKMVDLIGRKGSLTRSQLQHNHNRTAAQVNGLIEAVENGKVNGIQIVKEAAKNNIEKVTFLAI
jgi:hypothetical protein